MAVQDREETFRQHLGSIFLYKDELETQFQTALSFALTADDFKKLNTAVLKVEKEMQKLKLIINERATSTLQNLRPPVQATVNPQPQNLSCSQTGMHHRAGGGDRTLASSSTSQATRPQTTISSQQYQSKQKFLQEQKTKVFHQSTGIVKRPDWGTFQKTQSLPDSHMLFLFHISPRTTEETLFNVFSECGIVADVRTFSAPNSQQWKSGAIGFASAEVTGVALRQRFLIDGVEVTPRPYRPKDKWQPPVKQRRFQVYLGGVPVQASPRDIRIALQEHVYNGIDDIRVTYKDGQQTHRGFAYVDLENDADAQHLLKIRFVYIMNRQVECKPNTYPGSKGSSETIFDDHYGGETEAEPKETKLYSKPYTDEGSRNQSVPLGLSYSPAPEKTALNMCIMCKKNPQNCALLWCGHTDFCDQCGPKLSICPKNGCGRQVDKCQRCQP